MIRKFIAASALLLGGLVGAHASPVLSFIPSSNNVTVGQTVTVDIRIESVTDLYSWQLDTFFAPAELLNATGVTEGNFLGAGTTFGAGTIDNTLGSITTMFSSLSGLLGVDGDGILATISFKAMAVGVANLSFGDALLGNSSLDDIFFDNRFAGRASITIDRAPGGGGSVPEPATLALVALALTAAGASRRRAATPAIER